MCSVKSTWGNNGKVLEMTAKNWGQQRKSIGDDGKGLGMTAEKYQRQQQRIGDDSKETMAKYWDPHGEW